MKKILSFIVMMLLPVVAMAAFDGAKYYTINRNGESASFIYQNGTNMGIGSLSKDNGAYYWQLIPTGAADTYYIKNALTGQYVQTSKITLSSLVSMGDEPQEYIISNGATAGYYFLASADQTIDYDTDSTLGLNKGANGVVAYYIKTGRGNSYWDIKEADYSPSDPETSTEDDDVCPNVAAYRIPCGTLSTRTYLSEINIEGEGVLGELHYNASAPTSRHTLYTAQRIVVAAGGEVDFKAKMVGYNVKGAAVTVYADFDGDRQFEQTVKTEVQEDITAKLKVPADTKAIMGRIRVRVDQSGSVGANADVYGVCYDFPVYFGTTDGTRTLTVKANGDYRGSVTIEGVEGTTANFKRGEEVTVVAKAVKGYRFQEWRKGRNVVASTARYTTTMTEDKELVAIFVPVSGDDSECIRFTFSDTHTNPVCMVTDQDGNLIEGVSVSVTLSPEQYQKNTGTALGGQTDLTPNSGRDQDVPRYVTLCINDFPADYCFETIRARIAAVTSLGAFSTTSSRAFDFSVYTGSSAESLVLLASQTGVNINIDGKSTGADNTHAWSFTGAVQAPTNPLYVQVEMTNKTGYSVYSSLFGVDILKSDKQPDAVTTVSSATNDAVTFDLFGRRVSPAYHGIVIQDGKKLLRK